MIDIIILLVVGLFSGVFASLGIGGGFVLLLYLTAILSVNQIQAQFINLVFFIPIAVVSIIIHIKNKLIEKKVAIIGIISGTVGVFIGVMIATWLKPATVSKLFAVFIFIIGLKQLFSKQKNKNSNKS